MEKCTSGTGEGLYITADVVHTHGLVLWDLELHMLAVHNMSTHGPSKVKTAPLVCTIIKKPLLEQSSV